MTALLNPSPAYALGQPGALEIRGLNKHYRIDGKPLQVLSGIDLQVLPGEFVCIVGASGCGKSSLLRLIVGLEQDYEGLIRLDGETVRGTSLDRGLVFQDHRLFPWKTVEQNVALALKNQRLGKREKAERVAEHLALVGLQGFEQAYPHQLSGGMAQRAAIARALITRPKLLLLDEPMAGMGPDESARVIELIQALRQEMAILLIEHDMDAVFKLADRVSVLVYGKVIASGPVDQIRSDPRVQEVYLGSEA